jgi:hypothetical protein
MTRDDLERHLHNGEQWRFVKETDDPEYLGWILISKITPGPMPPFAPRLDPREERESIEQAVAWAEQMRRTPYHVHVVELKREVHEAGEYPGNEDYRNIENYYVATLDEVEEIVHRFGKTLESVRWRGDLKAP